MNNFGFFSLDTIATLVGIVVVLQAIAVVYSLAKIRRYLDRVKGLLPWSFFKKRHEGLKERVTLESLRTALDSLPSRQRELLANEIRKTIGQLIKEVETRPISVSDLEEVREEVDRLDSSVSPSSS